MTYAEKRAPTVGISAALDYRSPYYQPDGVAQCALWWGNCTVPMLVA
jgi:hypothetical protein